MKIPLILVLTYFHGIFNAHYFQFNGINKLLFGKGVRILLEFSRFIHMPKFEVRFVIFLRTRYKGHGVFLLAFGPSGFRRYLIKSRAITVGKIPPAAKNICKMSGGRYPMHIKLPYNQPTSPP